MENVARGDCRTGGDMNKEIGIGILLTVAIAGGLAYWYYGPAPAPQTRAEHSAPAPDAPMGEAIQYPVPAEIESDPLPALADSDPMFSGALAQLFGAPAVAAYLVPKNLIAQLVATIDSLDREPAPLRTRAIKALPKLPVVDTTGNKPDDKIFLSAKNSERYQPLTMALQTVGGKTLAELYLRYYPLFQQAYVELGFPQGYFNDRLIKIIDHLLATPEVKEPIPLVRPKVLYQFADPDLERRSSGQKILLRLGTDNARAIKAKLREIRGVVAAAPGVMNEADRAP